MPRSVLLYFCLAIAITWLFWGPDVLFQLGVRQREPPGWLYLLGGLGPIGAATILAWIEGKSAGVRSLYRGLCVWRVGARWYLVALALPLVIH